MQIYYVGKHGSEPLQKFFGRDKTLPLRTIPRLIGRIPEAVDKKIFELIKNDRCIIEIAGRKDVDVNGSTSWAQENYRRLREQVAERQFCRL